MKIALVCSSLETGKDGVGDYTRKLGIRLIEQGFNVTAIAIHDKHITESFVDLQPEGKNELSIIRIPSQWTKEKRFTMAKQYLKKLNPCWIILHYVPYGYDSSGLPFSLINLIQDIKRILLSKIFIFFHEVSVDCSFKRIKHIPLALGQRLIARKLLLHADKVATSIDLYAKRLTTKTASIPLIPIGSNISPLVSNTEEIDKLKKQINVTNEVIITTFGLRNHEQLLQAFQEVRCKYLNARLLILGKLRGVAAIPKDISAYVTVTDFLPEELIMKYLQASDLFIQLNNEGKGGINNKSGSLAAAFAAGLPVIGMKGKITNKLLLQHQPCIFINSTKDLPSSILHFFSLTDSQRKQYHIQSRAFFDHYLSWEKITDQYINLLNYS